VDTKNDSLLLTTNKTGLYKFKRAGSSKDANFYSLAEIGSERATVNESSPYRGDVKRRLYFSSSAKKCCTRCQASFRVASLNVSGRSLQKNHALLPDTPLLHAVHWQ
jgi:hypothetical protein